MTAPLPRRRVERPAPYRAPAPAPAPTFEAATCILILQLAAATTRALTGTQDRRHAATLLRRLADEIER